MGIKLVRADIVVLASAHNPSIMSPEWLRNKGLLAEKPINFIHTPDFSLFESDSYTITLDRQRLQIVAHSAEQDQSTVRSIARIAGGYIALLPEIPYTALGLNFSWSMASDDEIKAPGIELRLNPDRDWRDILEEQDLAYGGVIYARKDPYRLTITITPENESNLIYKFNFHYDITGTDAEKILSYLAEFPKLYLHSHKVIKSTAQ